MNDARTHRRHPSGTRSYCGVKNVPEERLREHQAATSCKVCRRSFQPYVPKTWAYRKKKSPGQSQGFGELLK